MHYRSISRILAVAFLAVAACSDDPAPLNEYAPPGRGVLAVGSTNFEVAADYAGIGDERMHRILLGLPDDGGELQFIDEILAHPDSAWIVDVDVPNDAEVYGPAAGTTMPVAAFVAYPAAAAEDGSRYAFPYHDAAYGEFEAMLAPGDSPRFADPDARYPLIVLSHGYSAHGIFDVGHAHGLASEGYIVAVPFYGDERTATPNTINEHTAFLRPLMTRALIDAIVDSEAFGDNVDAGNVGVSGHSFGGFTALAMAGGRYRANPSSVTDARVRAAVAAAPWVGGSYGGNELLAFGEQNGDLGRVTVPVLTAYGSADEVTREEYILPAMKQVGGPAYVVELVGQPHVFEGGSWRDRDNWERLFFAAYLKNDAAALRALATSDSMKGGNEDRQRFEYQKVAGSD